jgi:hypothetical protein
MLLVTGLSTFTDDQAIMARRSITDKSRRSPMKRGYLIILIVLLVTTILLLVTNGVLIYGMIRAQRAAASTLRTVRRTIQGISQDTFAYTFELQDEIPFKTSMPVNEEFTVPVETTIPVNTTVVVPINLGFTSYNLRVPINTVFPVSMEFTVPVSMTMDVDVSVPVDMEVPIEIPLGDTPLVAYLYEMDASLAELESQLADPMGIGYPLEPSTP